MPDGTPFKNPDGYWSYQTWTDVEVRTGPERNRYELAEQRQAIRALTGAAKSVIYAVRFTDGVIKIGCTTNFARRRTDYRNAEILAFRPGTMDEERAIHASLRRHVVHGREWYRAARDVIDVVNDLRSHFNLEPLPYEEAA
jgi:hypothetical protein